MQLYLLVVILIWRQVVCARAWSMPVHTHCNIVTGDSGFKKFNIYWNVPTQDCKRKFGIDVNVKKYGIKENTADGWKGEDITIFYSTQIGTYPQVLGDGTIQFGGIPQLANMTKHLQKMSRDIAHYIPDESFDGLAVIDWEGWRPKWEHNFDTLLVYKNLSINLVKERHPTWPPEKIELVAKEEFEDAAKKFILSTVNHAKQLRPFGKWGFYHYSTCYKWTPERNGTLPECDKKDKDLNDGTLWMFAALSGTYPSCYLSKKTNWTLNYERIYVQLKEQIRLALKAKRSERLPVYPYSKFRYDVTKPVRGSLYTKEDLISVMALPVMLEQDGLVLWDDNELQKSANSCRDIKTYVDDLLGPIAKSVINVSNGTLTSFCEKVNNSSSSSKVYYQKCLAQFMLTLL